MDQSSALFLIVLAAGAGVAAGLFLASRRLPIAGAPAPTPGQWSSDQAVLREDLARLGDQLRDLEHQRVSWQAQLNEQVQHMASSTEQLRRETTALGSALRRPQVRGRWGELQLRRSVELAGMVNHVDFSEQATTERADGGSQRPDLVVHLAGGRHIVVDAKVPLDGFLDAADSPEDPSLGLGRHVTQLRAHIDKLAARSYWREHGSPEFVVLFVPAESFLSAALTEASDLIEYSAAKHVVLASPTTLIALLRTVAHGWRHEALSQEAGRIHELGTMLYGRLGTLSGHLDQVGRALDGAVGAYNQAVGSYESRVLVAARRFEEFVPDSDSITPPRQISAAARSVGGQLELRRGSTQDPDHPHTVAM